MCGYFINYVRKTPFLSFKQSRNELKKRDKKSVFVPSCILAVPSIYHEMHSLYAAPEKPTFSLYPAGYTRSLRAVFTASSLETIGNEISQQSTTSKKHTMCIQQMCIVTLFLFLLREKRKRFFYIFFCYCYFTWSYEENRITTIFENKSL